MHSISQALPESPEYSRNSILIYSFPEASQLQFSQIALIYSCNQEILKIDTSLIEAIFDRADAHCFNDSR